MWKPPRESAGAFLFPSWFHADSSLNHGTHLANEGYTISGAELEPAGRLQQIDEA